MANSDFYSNEYKEQTFYAWYEDDKRSIKNILRTLPEVDGRKPSNATVEHWRDSLGWVERADSLEAELSIKMDNEVIDKRMEMFKQHEEIGSELIKKGRTYLEEKGITNDQAAIRAIDLGIATQRISVGMAEAYFKISKMSNEQITASLLKLLGKSENTDEMIDAEVSDIDTESK